MDMPPIPAVVSPASATHAARFQALLDRAKAIPKASVLPSPATAQRDTLPENLQAPLKRAVLVVPETLDPGAKIAVEDLAKYLQTVTGQAVLRVTTAPGKPLSLPAEATGATLITLGQGQAIPGLSPQPSGQKDGYALQAGQATIAGQTFQTVGLTGDDQVGLQYGLYRLMELSGKRFYSYTDTYTPPKGTAVMPANGYKETHAPSSQMKTRGFSPHLYHPVPLSFAFHEPSEKHLQMVKNYIDWHVANGQNYIMFPLLEHDQRSGFLPITAGDKNFNAWLPHAKAIVEYAHSRGVQMSIKPAFANYVSSNVYAINPLTATAQSMKLNKAWKKVEEAKKDVATAESQLARASNRVKAVQSLNTLKLKLGAAERHYQKTLDDCAAADRPRIEKLIDQLMQVPWDEITWNLGTSEFTPTNDDLTIRWMNAAADILKKKYPHTRTAARSHVPSHPHSEKYDESYFNLVRFADPAVGALVHTTHAYGLTDKAPVYGNADFTHKLAMLAHATPERNDIYYPETSYWVAHDVSVPLFMPVYMLNRKHDLEIVKGVEHLDGHVGFTTAWEWGYWLNDYTLARMQHHPEESLTEILDGALAPLGEARTPMVELLSECMIFQQEYLLDKNLIRHLQGFDSLTDFGVFANQNPLLNKVLKGTNSTPIRLRPSDLMKMNAAKLETFRAGELADLIKVEQAFEAYAARAQAMRAQVPEGAAKYLDELADGFQINALRAKQVRAGLEAAVLARKAELTGVAAYKIRGAERLQEARKATEAAMVQIRDREKDYREGPEYNTAKGDSLTLWGDRYLTPVHTGKYWNNTLEEIEKIYKPKPAPYSKR